MMKIFLTKDGKLETIDKPKKGCWISLVHPTEKELQEQSEQMRSKLASLEEEMKDKEELYRLWERKEQQLRELLG